jgi:hypothetical protein
LEWENLVCVFALVHICTPQENEREKERPQSTISLERNEAERWSTLMLKSEQQQASIEVSCLIVIVYVLQWLRLK